MIERNDRCAVVPFILIPRVLLRHQQLGSSGMT
jgi:hypothetical protein